MSLNLVTQITPEVQAKALWPSWYTPPTNRKYNFLDRSVAVTGLTIEKIRCAKRHRHISRVRWAIAHVMRDALGRSYGEIGESLNKDHSTIIYGVRKSRELVRTCQDHSNLVNALELIA